MGDVRAVARLKHKTVMLIFIALVTASIGVAGCGAWLRRQRALAPAWGLLAVQLILLAVAVLALELPRFPVTGAGIAAVAFLTGMAGTLFAIWSEHSRRFDLSEAIDSAAAVLTVSFASWCLFSDVGSSSLDRAVLAFTVTTALAVATSLIAIVTAPTSRRMPFVITSLGCALTTFVGYAFTVTSTSSGVPDSGPALVAGLFVGGVAAWTGVRIPVDSGKVWNFAQRLRNSLILYVALVPVFIVGVVATPRDVLPGAASIGVLAAMATLVLSRFSLAWREIRTLQTSVSIRTAISRMPTQASSVRTHGDLKRMLDDLAHVAATVVQANRAELRLLFRADGGSPPSWWGITDDERARLQELPIRSPSGSGGSAFRPYVMHADDRSLSDEERLVWTDVGKLEALIIPVHAGDRVLGQIDVWTPGVSLQIDSSCLSMSTDLGAEAGVMIEHAQLMLSTRGEIVEAEMLLTVSEIVSRAQTIDECLPNVAEGLLRHAEADRVTISLIDEIAGDVYIAADARAGSAISPTLQGNHWPINEWASYQELRASGRALAFTRDDQFTPDRLRQIMSLHGAESYLAIPGYSDDRMTSIVQVMSSSRILAESDEVRSIWHSTSRQIQLGIESLRALEQSRQRAQLETLRRRINEMMQTAHHLQDVFGPITSLFRAIDRVDGVSILSIDPNSGDYVVEAEWTVDPIPCRQPGIRHKADELVVLADFADETRARMRWTGQIDCSEKQRASLVASRVGAVIATPLRIEDRLVGALLLCSADERPFPQETIDLSEQIAGTIAIVIKSIELRTSDAETQEEQTLKLRMLQAATSHSDPIDALKAVAEAGLLIGGAESIDIAFIDPSGHSMIIAADSTIPEWPGVEEPGTVLPIGTGSIQQLALKSLEPQHWTSTQPVLGEFERKDIDLYDAHSWICAPLRVGGHAVGFLQVLSRQPDAFDARKIRMWDEVAQQVALVISTLRISFDNQRLSHQQQLLSRIHEASGTTASSAAMYQTIVDAGLTLDGVETCTLFNWHQEDNLLEVAADAVFDPRIELIAPGRRDSPLAWQTDDVPIRPRPISHFCLDDPDLDDAGQRYLKNAEAGRAAIFMLMDDGHVHGVFRLTSEHREPFSDETIRLGESIATASAAIVRNLIAREAERRIDEEQRALLILARTATTSTNEHQLLDVIAETVCQLCSAECAEVYILDPATRLIGLAAASSSDGGIAAEALGFTLPEGTLPSPWNRPDARVPSIIHSGDDERIPRNLRDAVRRRGIESIATIPLSAGDRARGLVTVYSSRPRRFTSAIVRSAATFVAQAEMALQHTRTRLEEARVADQRAILLRVSQAAGSSLNLDEVLAEIAGASLGLADSESCAIELYDPETDELVLNGIARVDDWVIPDSLLGKRRPFGSWSMDLLVREHGSVLIGTADDERINDTMRTELQHFQTESVIAHALTTGGAFVGVYYCFARQPNAYVEQDRWLSSEIAAHVNSAIQNARMLEREHIIAQERERLLSIFEAASRSLNLHDVLHEIANATLGLAGAESCHVELVDHANHEFITGAYAAVSDWMDDVTTVVGNRCPIGAWSVDHESVTKRDPISIGSRDDPRVQGRMLEDMVQFGTQSMLLIPIWNADECVGILNIYARRKNAFSDAQQTIAYTLATHAANAIQNAQTHERERDRRHHQEALLTLTSAATSSLDVHLAMQAVCTAVSRVTGAESATVGVYRPEWQSFEIVADVTSPDWDYADSVGVLFPIADYPILGYITANTSAITVDQGTSDLSFRRLIDDNGVGLETYAVVPLWLNDACLGYIGLFDRHRNKFTQDVLDLLEEASSMIGLALSNGLQWRTEQTRAANRAAVVSVGRIAVSDAEIGQKLTQIGSVCAELERVDGVAIYQWNDAEAALVRLVCSGDTYWQQAGMPDDQFHLAPDHPVRSCIERMRTLTLDRLTHPEQDAQGCVLDAFGANAVAVLPMGAEEQVSGIIVLASATPHSFPDDTLRAAEEIATQVALTIKASRLLETTRRYARQQSALLTVNQAVMNATQTSLHDVLHEISNETMRLIGAECCEIESLLPAKDATELLAQVVADDWHGAVASSGLELPLSDWPISRHVLDSQDTIVLDPGSVNLTDKERGVLFSMDSNSAMIAPMIVDGKSVGIISFYSRETDAFSQADRILAREFGSLAALAIDRARTHMELAEQASYDGLTGLLNHRALLERIEHHIALADRSNDPMSLLMIDLDDFKMVNDVHGHVAGDFVLREIAGFLKRTFRASDLVGRYGGDEFTAVLPGTDIVQAIALSERVQAALCAMQITLPSGAIVVPSTSIGYASYPSLASDVQTLIDAADRSMYEVKNRSEDRAALELDSGMQIPVSARD